MDWGMVSAISTAFMVLVILATAVFAALQLKQVSKSRKAQTFMELSKYLQREEIREARRVLIGISGKEYKDWSKEETEAAEKASHTYDVAGVMVFRKLIEKELVVDEWRRSVIKCWEAAQPMIKGYQKERGKDFWHNFEKLYDEAKRIKTEELTN
jgi:hypothetical protein